MKNNKSINLKDITNINVPIVGTHNYVVRPENIPPFYLTDKELATIQGHIQSYRQGYRQGCRQEYLQVELSSFIGKSATKQTIDECKNTIYEGMLNIANRLAEDTKCNPSEKEAMVIGLTKQLENWNNPATDYIRQDLKCECGAHACRSNEHSTWCVLYD